MTGYTLLEFLPVVVLGIAALCCVWLALTKGIMVTCFGDKK